MPVIFEPLVFRGIAVATQMHTREVPKPDGSVEKVETVAAILNTNFQTCMVLSIIRVGPEGALTTEDLDNPEIKPWFLMRAERPVQKNVTANLCDTLIFNFIANEESQYYPVHILNGEYRLWMYNHRNDQIDWNKLSLLDEQLTIEAIGAYLRSDME